VGRRFGRPSTVRGRHEVGGGKPLVLLSSGRGGLKKVAQLSGEGGRNVKRSQPARGNEGKIENNKKKKRDTFNQERGRKKSRGHQGKMAKQGRPQLNGRTPFEVCRGVEGKNRHVTRE